MSKPKRPVVAICYDFDGTLSPHNMQEYDFIPQLGVKSKDFWAEANKRAKDDNADPILTYMNLMVEEARASNNVKIDRKAIVDCGKKVTYFKGVEEWFKRIDSFAKTCNLEIQHFIISSGLKEMIEGTSIKKYIREVFASSFSYDQHDVAKWPAVAVNFTTKTQFLFRINKGKFNVWDEQGINKYVADADRPIPFARMIYLGDGSTDIPCMKLVKEQGGNSIAVYKPGSTVGRTVQLQHLLDSFGYFTQERF